MFAGNDLKADGGELFTEIRVLSINLSRSSVDSVNISIAAIAAVTIGGATGFENKYGRESWRGRSMISFLPLV